jgi:hypothetical protein
MSRRSTFGHEMDAYLPIDRLRLLIQDAFFLGRANGQRVLMYDSVYSEQLKRSITDEQLWQFHTRNLEFSHRLIRRLRRDYPFTVLTTNHEDPFRLYINTVDLDVNLWDDPAFRKYYISLPTITVYFHMSNLTTTC